MFIFTHIRRQKLEEEKVQANNVAYQWQCEAEYFQKELLIREEELRSANLSLAELKVQLDEHQQEIEDAVTSAALSKATAVMATARSSSKDSAPVNSPAIELEDTKHGNDDDDIWDDEAFDGDVDVGVSILKTPMSGNSKQLSLVTSSVAKRVLITWDKTAVDRNKSKRYKQVEAAKLDSSTMIHRSTFLIAVSIRFAVLLSYHLK